MSNILIIRVLCKKRLFIFGQLSVFINISLLYQRKRGVEVKGGNIKENVETAFIFRKREVLRWGIKTDYPERLLDNNNFQAA